MNIIILYFILVYFKIEFLFSRLIASRKEDSILIIKMDAIGDMVIWLDSAQEIRKNFAHKKIILLCDKSFYELANRITYFDQVIGIDKKRLFNVFYRLRLINTICRKRFELLINPVYSRDYFFQDILVSLIKAGRKIGCVGEYTNNDNILNGLINDKSRIKAFSKYLKLKSDKYYSELIPSTDGVLMEKKRNAEFIRGSINPEFKSNIPTLPFELPILSEFLSLKEKSYVVLFIGASTKRKLWSKDNYVKLLSELCDNDIVVCGGKGEEKIWNDISNSYNFPTIKMTINLIGKTSLVQLFSVISGARYMITNDTSASHITVITRTPSVCLLGGAHFGRFHPYEIEDIKEVDLPFLPKVVYNKLDCYYCNLDCKYIKDKETIWPCIEKITPEQVLEKIFEIEKEINSYESKDINNNSNI
ncbi:MAG: glycosyl transferase family 9 [Bacteroidetes bacterium]|nr:glycosyl transferase family 9 [Bacteroidota bacterium]